MKYICQLILFFWAFSAHAVPNIAITNLILLHDQPNAFNIKRSESDFIFYNSPKVENIIKSQSHQFESQLVALVAESNVFTVSEGNSIITIWQMSDPKILQTLYTDQDIDIESEAVESTIKNPGPNTTSKIVKLNTNSQKYVLIGWVNRISEIQTKEPIPGTNKISFIYSVEIHVKYKIIDRDTQKIVGQFLANGHSGIAQILPSVNYPTTYGTTILIYLALKNLASNVQHGLLLQRQNGLFDEIVVTKNVSTK